MFVKILGIIDIFIAVFFWVYGVFGLSVLKGFILFLGIFLLIKGLIFIGGLRFASFLDIFAALLIIMSASIIALPKIVIIVLSLFILQKGVFSLM